MTSNKKLFNYKVVDRIKNYNFHIYHINIQTILDIDMVYMKVIVLNTIYNFVVEKFFVCLVFQNLILNFRFQNL